MSRSPRRWPAVLALACGLAPCASAAPVATSIVIGLGRTITPEQAQAPALFVDSDGRLVVVDQARGFVLGRFRVPAGMGTLAPSAEGGTRLESEGVIGPQLPLTPMTNLQPVRGFPSLADGPVAGSPCLIDLDRDGRAEIVTATTSGTVQVIGADGRPRAGWPRRTDETFYAAPSAGDIDGDGRPEIVIPAFSGRLYAWRADGSPVPGWPQVLLARGEEQVAIAGAAALADLDGNGRDEICVGTLAGKVWLMGGNGLVRPGWPKTLPPAADPPNPASIFAAPALADLDEDGVPEVIVATNAGRVHAWDGAGDALPGWPVAVPYGARAGYGGVAVGDVNGDGHPEVVVTSEQGYTGPASVSAFSARGVMLPGWPFHLPETANAGPALGDVNHDGTLDVIAATIGGNPQLYALDGRAARPLPGWPVTLEDETVNASPVVADLNGDGDPDILVATLTTGLDGHAGLWAYDHRGAQLRGFPILLPRDEIVRAAPAVGDLDGDGELELFAATEALAYVYGWELGALCDPSLMPWQTEAAGPARTGRIATPIAALAAPATPGDGVVLGGESPLTTVSFDLKQDADVSLRIYDVQNRPVRTLLEHRLPPGRYAIFWDGRADNGQVVPSGVYFYKLALGGRATTRQLLLLQ